MLDIRLSLLGLLLVAVPSQAQQPASSGAQAVPSYVLVRKLSDTDVVKKREGGFFTGLPEISSDPVAGQGFGLRGSYYNNGKRSDPLFAYTPYREKFTVNAQFTTGQAR